ncbi:MAG: epimerase [Nocardioides sp.]|nr:epimerase [Nocardioides sp.]
MRLLVLGGSRFLSAATVADAVTRGHEVVAACRGEAGPVPAGARVVHWDRSTQPPPVDEVGPVDAVVDVARHPSWVRAAVEAWPDAHWVFVSTINVYADDATPGLTPADTPLHPARHDDADLTAEPEAYGPMKVACEEAVRSGAASSAVVRPGLIIGPGDPSGRFTYWPERLAGTAEDEPVLAGGDPADVVQVVDARDLAAWLVTLAERRTTGDLDGIGPATALGEVLAAVADGAGAHPEWRWVDHDVLAAADVQPWMGDRSLPLWLPRPAYDGMLARDWTPSRDAGLVVRPLAETARDTLAWLRATPDAVRTGLTRDEEREVLAGLS